MRSSALSSQKGDQILKNAGPSVHLAEAKSKFELEFNLIFMNTNQNRLQLSEKFVELKENLCHQTINYNSASFTFAQASSGPFIDSIVSSFFSNVELSIDFHIVPCLENV